jgi:hypothetical protein
MATSIGSSPATALTIRSYEAEFEAPFARLEYVSRDCFDLSWHRHTGEWYCLFQRQSLAEASGLIEASRISSRAEPDDGRCSI